MIRITFLLLTVILFLVQSSYSQLPQKRETRAVWIATVGNIDWPSKQGLSVEQQKREMIQKLNFIKDIGMNTVIVQVRPAADAFYKSSYEPWSRYLSGKQGQYPGYDPLQFIIEECHKRNLDVHAWFNPYRALVNSKSNPNPESHITMTHPDWIIHYGGKSYFDPGNPKVKDYIIKVMIEAVKNYDIDALHIDDYFYPYPIKGVAFADNASYTKYGQGMSKADWRRSSVNTFIKTLSDSIKSVKPWVKFGVSPFGIWRNIKDDPEGSNTRGSSCYDELYSDVRLWQKMNWIDYIAPQLYWERGHKAADFNALLPWWTQNKYDRELFVGLGLYRMAEGKSAVWQSPNEILAQIKAVRAAKTEGIVLYSLSSFDKINHAIQDSLKKKEYFGTISIPTTNRWLDDIAPSAPVLSIKAESQKIILNWQPQDDKEPLKYLVYRFRNDEKLDLNRNDRIIALTQSTTFTDVTQQPKQFYYIVTALDRLWNESAASNLVTIK